MSTRSGSGSGDVQALLECTCIHRDLSTKPLRETVFDPSYSVGKFLGGMYPAPYAVNVDLLTTLAPAG